MIKPFPDCDVTVGRTDYIDIKNWRESIIIRVILTPTSKERPTKEQIDQVARDLIDATCASMEKQRKGS